MTEARFSRKGDRVLYKSISTHMGTRKGMLDGCEPIQKRTKKPRNSSLWLLMFSRSKLETRGLKLSTACS